MALSVHHRRVGFGLIPILHLLASCSPTGTAAPQTSGAPARVTDARRATPGESLIASAPPGLSRRDLGRPFTADFRRFQGTDGQTLFPVAGAVLSTPQHAFEQQFDTIDSEEELAANASAWGIRTGGSEHRRTRYASLRVLEIDYVDEVDDATGMREAPPGAVYYPWRIYMGRRYEIVLEGSREQFHAGVRADLGVFSGEVGAFAKQHGLRHTVRALGLAPRNDRAMFSRSPEQLESNYRSTIEEPVAVLVEWRRIPGRNVAKRPIEWAALPKGCAGAPGCEPCRTWSFRGLEVTVSRRKSNGDAWDADGSAPDVVLVLSVGRSNRTSGKRQGYTRTWKLEPPVLVDAGQAVRLRAIDRDLMVDDLVFIHHGKPGPTLAGGKLELGAGSATLLGDCVDPGAVPSRKGHSR